MKKIAIVKKVKFRNTFKYFIFLLINRSHTACAATYPKLGPHAIRQTTYPNRRVYCASPIKVSDTPHTIVLKILTKYAVCRYIGYTNRHLLNGLGRGTGTSPYRILSMKYALTVCRRNGCKVPDEDRAVCTASRKCSTIGTECQCTNPMAFNDCVLLVGDRVP